MSQDDGISYSLVAFDGQDRALTGVDAVTLRVQIQFIESQLTLIYDLRGDLEKYIIPPFVQEHQLTDFLWKKTCFEAFLTWEHESTYWELNFSPSGDWNIYRFHQYRENQCQENRIQIIEKKIQWTQKNHFQLRITIDLKSILPSLNSLSYLLGCSAVLEDQDHHLTYWAIRHQGIRPDFHLRQNFIPLPLLNSNQMKK